jgi:hypothetical protein
MSKKKKRGCCMLSSICCGSIFLISTLQKTKVRPREAGQGHIAAKWQSSDVSLDTGFRIRVLQSHSVHLCYSKDVTL